MALEELYRNVFAVSISACYSF